MAPRRIAILGGGPAALSAAFHLTAQPDWRTRYEITVYQLGWRLGGKCATGRLEQEHYRIREHGIHLAGNFYSNLFALTKQAYQELYGADGSKHSEDPIRTVDDALIPGDYSLVADSSDGQHQLFDVHTPHNAVKPWDVDWRPDPGYLASQAVGTIVSILHGGGQPAAPGTDPASRHSPFNWGEFISGAFKTRVVEVLEKDLLGLVEHAVKALDDHTVVGRIIELLDTIVRAGWDALGNAHSPQAEWVWVQIDYLATLMRGMVRDQVFERGVARLDHLSYRTWLRMHGAAELTLASPIVDLPCNICFQYENGDSSRVANMSAAAYVMFMARWVMSQGAPLWYFRAGTADTIIAPIYRVLRQRGVQFAFFHKVESLKLSADGSELVEIECEVQAHPKAGPLGYEPLLPLPFDDGQGHAGVLQCWPGEPRFDQLEDGERLEAFLHGPARTDPGLFPAYDLESYWCPSPPDAKRRTLRKGEDFDFAILGLSIGAIPVVAPALIEAHPERWKPAIHHGQAIATQQVQIWLKASLAELGWDAKRTGGGGNRLVGCTLPAPLQDFCDFTDLVAWERWPGDGKPGALLYFCGPLAEPADVPDFSVSSYPETLYLRTGPEASKALEIAMDTLFPTAGGTGPRSGFPPQFMQPPGSPVPEGDPIWSHYLRQNIDPTERYVLSLPGSLAHRLKAWESGVSNLTLTGDWIDNGLNVGSFEAAVMSGMLASYALTGSPRVEDIKAYVFLNPDPPRKRRGTDQFPLAATNPGARILASFVPSGSPRVEDAKASAFLNPDLLRKRRATDHVPLAP